MPKTTSRTKTTRGQANPGADNSRNEHAAKRAVSSDRQAPAKVTKLDLLSDLLRQPDGASINEMCKATGWQSHSIRGALAGALKRRGLVISSDVSGGVRRYRASLF